ncbi:MAG: YraN family protein [Betaproteobacteria bacterium]
MKQTTTESGRLAEDRALAYLQSHGLALIKRNFRSRRGEIDLIMRDASTLVFVEVRQRKNHRFGGAADSITPTKQARLWQSAQVFLQRFPSSPACRFDAVCIDGTTLTWLRHILSA